MQQALERDGNAYVLMQRQTALLLKEMNTTFAAMSVKLDQLGRRLQNVRRTYVHTVIGCIANPRFTNMNPKYRQPSRLCLSVCVCLFVLCMFVCMYVCRYKSCRHRCRSRSIRLCSETNARGPTWKNAKNAYAIRLPIFVLSLCVCTCVYVCVLCSCVSLSCTKLTLALSLTLGEHASL